MARCDTHRRGFLVLQGLGTLGALAELAGCAAPKPAPVADRRPAPSLATSVNEYRFDAAKHIYAQNDSQVFRGKLPPLLHAITVVRISVAANGDLYAIDWMRTPHHAPEVVAAIEQKIRMAAPFPAPQNLGATIYTETWLWDKSGAFQLDTLTEGQM